MPTTSVMVRWLHPHSPAAPFISVIETSRVPSGCGVTASTHATWPYVGSAPCTPGSNTTTERGSASRTTVQPWPGAVSFQSAAFPAEDRPHPSGLVELLVGAVGALTADSEVVVCGLPDSPVHRDRGCGGGVDGQRFGVRRGGGRRSETDAEHGGEKTVESESPWVCGGVAHCVLLP